MRESNTFALTAEWQDGYRARFVGRILASGRAEGGVYLGSSSKPELSWYSEQPLTCGWRSGKTRGNLTSRISGNAPVKTSGIEKSPLTTPFISERAGSSYAVPSLRNRAYLVGWRARSS